MNLATLHSNSLAHWPHTSVFRIGVDYPDVNLVIQVSWIWFLSRLFDSSLKKLIIMAFLLYNTVWSAFN